MQLWHPNLLPELPDRLLTALHRDLCKIRSSQWRSPTNVRTWFYALPWGSLVWYHGKVIREMQRRKWKPSAVWFDPLYRGKMLPIASALSEADLSQKKLGNIFIKTCPIPLGTFEQMLQKWKTLKGE